MQSACRLPRAHCLAWHTGMHGHSTVRRVRVSDGAVLSSHPLTKEHFGEGLTKMGGKLYQLTWTRPDGFIYDAERMEQVRRSVDWVYAGATHTPYVTEF
eukprot:354857-Chlamydomonas_euryale.AAC.11